MRWHHLLAALIVGSMAVSGSAGALTIVDLDRDEVAGTRGESEACARYGCVQPVQMPMWPFGDRQGAGAMPADQRQLLARLLSPELSEVVSPAERDLLSKTLERGDRLSAEAMTQLSALLREKQSLRAERLETVERAREEERRRQAAAEAERQRQAELAAAAEAERQRQGQAQATTAEAERRRQTEQAAAEAARQRQAEAQASAEAERQRQAERAAAEAERQRQAAEAAQALAEAKREAEAAAANAARLVFYDEFPPLQPL